MMQLEEQMKERRIQTKDIDIILEETNDIRKGADGIETAKKLIKVLDEITKATKGFTTTVVIEIH